MNILITKDWTAAELMKDAEGGGKKRGRAAGGWIDDIAAQKKVITLCPLCTNKFNPAKVHYRKEKEFPVCQAKCDGCSTFDSHCSWYIYDELYSTVRSTADERRALAQSRAARIKRGYL
jgi:type II secretory ATPase GspE/PulE/Tfp pilus assembly ATPase PilB-like protein